MPVPPSHTSRLLSNYTHVVVSKQRARPVEPPPPANLISKPRRLRARTALNHPPPPCLVARPLSPARCFQDRPCGSRSNFGETRHDDADGEECRPRRGRKVIGRCHLREAEGNKSCEWSGRSLRPFTLRVGVRVSLRNMSHTNRSANVFCPLAAGRSDAVQQY